MAGDGQGGAHHGQVGVTGVASVMNTGYADLGMTSAGRAGRTQVPWPKA